jgi:Polymer-forming cytoskeletal
LSTDTSHSREAQRSTPRDLALGEELTVTGNVKAKGKLRLDGRVQGDIHCVSLVLGQNSQLEGNATAEDVVISGRLKGSVRPTPMWKASFFIKVSRSNRVHISKADRVASRIPCRVKPHLRIGPTLSPN